MNAQIHKALFLITIIEYNQEIFYEILENQILTHKLYMYCFNRQCKNIKSKNIKACR